MVGAEADSRVDLDVASDPVGDAAVVGDDVAAVFRRGKLASGHFDERAQVLGPFVSEHDAEYAGRVPVTVVSAVIDNSGHYAEPEVRRQLPLEHSAQRRTDAMS